MQRGEVVCVGDFAPKLAAFWVDEGVCVGAMLESGTPDEVKAVQAIAEGRPSVDVEKLRACATAEAALPSSREKRGGGLLPRSRL